jgi:hypothetical protein
MTPSTFIFTSLSLGFMVLAAGAYALLYGAARLKCSRVLLVLAGLAYALLALDVASAIAVVLCQVEKSDRRDHRPSTIVRMAAIKRKRSPTPNAFGDIAAWVSQRPTSMLRRSAIICALLRRDVCVANTAR